MRVLETPVLNYCKSILCHNYLIHSSKVVFNILSLHISFYWFSEILDYGYPQKTDSGILKTYITQQGVRAQVHILLMRENIT